MPPAPNLHSSRARHGRHFAVRRLWVFPILAGLACSGEDLKQGSTEAIQTSGGVSPEGISGLQEGAAPSAGLDTNLTAEIDGAKSEIKALTKSSSIVFNLSCTAPLCNFACSLDGTVVSPCVSPLTLKDLKDGPHKFSARAADLENQIDDTPALYSWVVDLTPPDTLASCPAANTNKTQVEVTYSSSDAAATFTCLLDAGTEGDCDLPFKSTGLLEGKHQLTITAADLAGNKDGSPVLCEWTVDLTPPDTSITSSPPLNTNTSGAVFSFTSTETDVTFSCRMDGEPFAACSSPHSLSGLADGLRVFEVASTDKAGNADTSPARHEWSVNTQAPSAPTVRLEDPAPASGQKKEAFTNVQSVNLILLGDVGAVGWCVSETVSAKPALLDRCWCAPEIDVTTLSPTEPCPVRLRPTLHQLTNGEGSKTVYAWTQNEVGTISLVPGIAKILLDTKFPTSNITAPINNATVQSLAQIAGDANDGANNVRIMEILISRTQDAAGNDLTPPVYWDGTAWGTPVFWIALPEILPWSYTSPAWSDGTYSIQSRASDFAGNVQAPATISTFKFDSPPTFAGLTSAVAATTSQVDLAWSAGSDTVTPAASLVYVICRSESPGSCASFFSSNYSTTAGAANYSVTGLGGSAAHYFVARAQDAAGNRDGNSVEKWAIPNCLSGGVICTLGGAGTAGFTGDGGSPAIAAFNNPMGIASDSAGHVYLADQFNHRVRKISTTGAVSTIAGKGTAGYGGNGGPPTEALLWNPSDVAVDSDGHIFIADQYNHRIRMIPAFDAPPPPPPPDPTTYFFGVAVLANTIYDIAGNGTGGFSGDGGAATSAKLNYPRGIAVDSNGHVFIADYSNHRVRMVAKTSGTFFGQSMTANRIYTIAGNGTAAFAGDGGPATSANLNSPHAVTVDSGGNVYIADYNNHRIRRVVPAGTISTVAGNGTAAYAGDGGAATAASLKFPTDVAVDAAGNVYIADTGNHRIRKVDTGGTISTFSGDGTAGFTGDGAVSTGARVKSPSGIAVGAASSILISDTANNRIRLVRP